MTEVEQYRPKLDTLQQFADKMATTIVPSDITAVKTSVSDVWRRWEKLQGRVEQSRSEVNEALELLLQFEDTAQALSSQVEHAHGVATTTIAYTNLTEVQTQLIQAKVYLICAERYFITSGRLKKSIFDTNQNLFHRGDELAVVLHRKFISFSQKHERFHR